MKHLLNLIVILCFVLIAYGGIPPNEINALQYLYNSTEGYMWNWRNKSLSWNFIRSPQNPCSWEGVDCDSTSSYINSLSLSSVGMNGTLPSQLGNIIGLTQLSLSSNRIFGTIHSKILSLSSLAILDLSSTYVKEDISKIISYLNNSVISTLNLSNNPYISGSIPDSICELQDLTSLDVSGCDIRGNVPTSIGCLKSLKLLNLSNNKINGALPISMGNMSSLIYLNINFNSLTGSIPTSLGLITVLQYLKLNRNSLKGIFASTSLPLPLPLPAGLLHCDVSFNRHAGSIPSSIATLSSLSFLDLSNNVIIGSIPSSIGYLASSLILLNMGNNRITGRIPSSLGKLTRLLQLDISNNRISGSIPSEITTGLAASLITLKLGVNRISGSIPTSLVSMTRLSVLDMSGNIIGGKIPAEVGNMVSLTIINLGGNRITGSLPTSMGLLTGLVDMNINTNRLSGTIPNEIGYLTRLQLLRLFSNSLVGSIPSSLGLISGLSYLSIYVNSLQGSIPSSLGNCVGMYYLGLYSNRLTGTVPDQLGNMVNMQFLRLFSNKLTGTIPATLLSHMSSAIIIRLNDNSFVGSLPVFSDMSDLLYLDFSGNSLSSTLPSSIGVHLTSMEYLYLNDNKFIGNIPSIYGNLINLKYMRLDHNKLSGTLPSSLSSMTSLQVLLVQSNNLRGSPDRAFNASTQKKLQNVDLSQNGFDGTLPGNIFLLPNLITFAAIQNCFQGSLPASICEARRLTVLSLNGLRGGRSCTQTYDFVLKKPSVVSGMEGSIPSCIWSLGNLSTVQISGNGVGGELVTPPSHASFRDVDVSNNKMEGTVPRDFQRWPFYSLDISGNKLSGTWTEVPRGFNPNVTSIKMAINRISGDLPAQFKYTKDIDVLSGNMFRCSPDLPVNDPSINSYVCGSSGLDTALNLIAECFAAAVIIMILVLIYGMRKSLRTHSNKKESLYSYCKKKFIEGLAMSYYWHSLLQIYIKAEMTRQHSRKQHLVNGLEALHAFVDVSQLLRSCTILLVFMTMFVCLPLYPCLRRYVDHGSASTQSFQYNWDMSLVFLSGLSPTILVFILWNCSVLVYTFYIGLTDKKLIDLKYTLKQINDSKDKDKDKDKYGDGNNNDDLHNTKLQSLRRKTVVTGKSMMTTFLAFLILVFDMVLILLLNGLFVYIQLSDLPASYKSGSQFAKAVIDMAWSVIVPILLSLVVKRKSMFIWWRVVISIFNTVLAPIAVTLVLDDACFKLLFVPPDEVKTIYYFTACLFFSFNTDTGILSCTNYGRFGPLESTYSPAFVYNNRCSVSLLTKYIPTFIYKYCISGFILPWFTVILPSFVSYSSIVRRLLAGREQLMALVFAGILWPRDTIARGEALLPGTDIMVDYLTDFTVFLTFGITSPPLAICIVITIITKVTYWQIYIGRFIDRQASGGMRKKLLALEESCKKLAKSPSYCMFVVIFGSAIFQTLILLDMLTDSSPILAAFWPCVVMTGLCIFIHILLRMYHSYSKRLKKKMLLNQQISSTHEPADITSQSRLQKKKNTKENVLQSKQQGIYKDDHIDEDDDDEHVVGSTTLSSIEKGQLFRAKLDNDNDNDNNTNNDDEEEEDNTNSNAMSVSVSRSIVSDRQERKGDDSERFPKDTTSMQSTQHNKNGSTTQSTHNSPQGDSNHRFKSDITAATATTMPSKIDKINKQKLINSSVKKKNELNLQESCKVVSNNFLCFAPTHNNRADVEVEVEAVAEVHEAEDEDEVINCTGDQICTVM